MDININNKKFIKMTLKDKVKKVSTLSLEFVNLSIQSASDGTKVAVLELSDPVEFVRGSQEVEIGGKMQGLTARDVTEVKVIESDFDKIDWDETTETGAYVGDDLSLDVAKRTGQVWLTSKPFSQAASEFRKSNAESRLNALFAKTGMNKENAEATNSKSYNVVE